MMSFILNHINVLAPWGYFLVFGGLLLEGEVVLFAAAFLTYQGFFNFPVIVAVVFGGVLLGDSLWYWVGTHFHRAPKFLQRAFDHLGKHFDDHLQHRTLRTLLVSKFAYGFHRATLLRAGFLRIAFGRFLRADLVPSTAWILILGVLGYLSSASFQLARSYVRYAEYAFGLIILIFVIAIYILNRISKNKL